MNVEWLLTEKCNFSCKYCGLYDNSKNPIEERAAITHFLIETKAYQLVNDFDFFIFGGEPFLHPEIEYIVEELNRLDIRYTFQTNLSKTSAKVIKKILETEPIMNLNISVHLSQQSLDTYINLIQELYSINQFRDALSNIEIMYDDITTTLAWYSLKNYFPKVEVILCPVSDFLVEGFGETLAQFNKIREMKVFEDIAFEDIITRGPDGKKKQRSIIWQEFLEKKQSPKGKPCLLKGKFRMFDSKFNEYNCCFHASVDQDCCPYDTCFLG